MRQESVLARIMNFIVSSYVYFVALTLVFYMVSSLVTGLMEVATGLLDISGSLENILRAPERNLLELDLLHTIAFTIVLVKAYKILISYAQRRHVSIKYLIEIAIIAPTIEIVFNATKYSVELIALFAVFAFANLLAYLFFYPTIKHVSNDYEHEACEPIREKLKQKIKEAEPAAIQELSIPKALRVKKKPVRKIAKKAE